MCACVVRARTNFRVVRQSAQQTDSFTTEVGTSADPCFDNYHGVAPFSEPEPAAMSRAIWGLRDRVALYLTLHSYGQFWLTPWGFTYDVPDDYDEMVRDAWRFHCAWTIFTLERPDQASSGCIYHALVCGIVVLVNDLGPTS